MIELPRRQKEVYQYILSYKKKHGYEPSTPHMAKHFGVTTTTIQQTMAALKKKGLVKPQKPQPRGEYEVIHTQGAQTD